MADFEWDDAYDNPKYDKDEYEDNDEVNQTYQDLTSDLPDEISPQATKPQISDTVWDVRALDTAVNQLYTDAYSKWGIKYDSIDSTKFGIDDGRLILM